MKPWVKLWRHESARFRSMPLTARMLASYVLKFVDEGGALPLGKRDAVTAVSIAIGADPSERRTLKPAVRALMEHGYFAATDGLLVIGNFPRYQEQSADVRPTNDNRETDARPTRDRREIPVSDRNHTLAQNVLSSEREKIERERESEIYAREAPPPEAPTPRHPTGVRAEALRTGYVERFQRAMPGIGLPSVAGPGNGGPWLEVAREVTDEQVPVLLDAFFADCDPFVAKDRAPGKLTSQRVRLLTQGPSRPKAARGQARAATHEEFARLAAEGSDVGF